MSGIREGSLFDKLRILPKRGLGRVVECVVLLWFVLADPGVPRWAKALAATALAYFLCPVDALPDFLPSGFVDDAALLVSTAAKLTGLASPELLQRAREKRRELGL
ncbi:MAG: DUF1232 domain-containing protein [Candidatus Sumerlaeia bacterium]|nr:DUF1232 domain-containing protein [Candidatus Sumerlaeia bacterium]